MAELSNMLQLDENKNTSTLNNHVPESDEMLLSSTSNGVNVTSEYSFQTPIAVKGNISEVNSNIKPQYPKNLNTLTAAETEGSFATSEIVPPLLDISNASYKTSNLSLLGDANSSFRSLNGSYLVENFQSPNNSVNDLLDDTLSKVVSPSLHTNANVSLQENERNTEAGIPFNVASPELLDPCASFTEAKPTVNSPLNTTSSVEPFVPNSSLQEAKGNVNIQVSIGNASSLLSEKSASFTEDKSDSSFKSLVNISTVDLPVPDSSLQEAEGSTDIEVSINNASLPHLSEKSASFTEDKPNSFIESPLNITSTAESPIPDSSLQETEGSVDVQFSTDFASLHLSEKSASFTEDKQNSLVKSPLNIATVDVQVSTDFASLHLLEKSASFTEDKQNSLVKSPLNIATVDLPVPDSSLQEAEGNTGVYVSVNESSQLAEKSASFTEGKLPVLNDPSSPKQDVKNDSIEVANSSALDEVYTESSAFTSGNSDSLNLSQSMEIASSDNLDIHNSSRLIDFTRVIQSNFPAEEFPFKVPYLKIDSPKTVDKNETDFQASSLQPSNVSTVTSSPTNVSQAAANALDSCPKDKANAPNENPFGVQKSDPFDVMGMDINTSPSDNFIFKVPETPVDVDNEEFTDAVQFFKDPSSFQYLENIETSQTGPNVPRSSLYIKFDPLHSAFPSQRSADDILQALKTETSKQGLNLSARESLGNILISFDSPRKADCRDAKVEVLTAPARVYTEEELQQHLKVNELTNQEMLLKKQREMEEELVRKEREMIQRSDEKDAKIAHLEDLLRTQQGMLTELALVSTTISERNGDILKKSEAMEEENTKLKGDVKTLTEDLQSVETTFADFHKRYEQCKGMLKTYKDNEELLRTKLKQQEEAYQDLQDRTQDATEKSVSEINGVKKASEAQIAVLKAQLKKAEMKISGLESDIKQIRIENSQLGGICDDLMEKVGKS